MPNIKIGNKTFTDVENINLPLADGTGQASFGTGGALEYIEWHQCPEAVRKFVDEVTYDPNDYSASHIDEYAPASPLVSNYKPIGKTVGNKTFYNEIPNLETPYQTDGKYGTVKPLDQVRYINTPSAPNVRDLGSWACDGGTVKYGLLYRGGYLSKTDRDVLVGECGIRHDLDLRGTAEANITKSPLGDDVHYTCATAYNWYSLSNKEIWKENLRCVFDAVAHNEPLYFHCAAGADRTGTLACVLEGLLGMSQSDIDKDYELTCFYFGTATDEQARRRNESEWQGLISAINAYTGGSFRDRCIAFVAALGFTADEINTYRKLMIDGTPEEITLDLSEYAVTYNLAAGVNTGNTKTAVNQYQSYEAAITCDAGYVIESVKVNCDGADITATAWRGTVTNLNRTVKATLENCTINNVAKKVIDGQSYAAKITALGSYTLDGAAITVTMGGVDMSKYYKDGVIAIPNVTGNIEITVTAVRENLSDNLVDIYGITENKRVSLTTGLNVDARECCVVGATADEYGIIPYAIGDIFYVKGAEWPDESDSATGFCWYEDVDGTHNQYTGNYLYKNDSRSTLSVDDDGIATIVPSRASYGDTTRAALRFTLKCSDPTQLVIQKNKKISGGVSEEPVLVNRMVVQEENLNKRASGLYNIIDGAGNFVCDPIAVDLTKSCKVKFVNTATLFEKIMGYIGDDYFGNSKVTLLDTNENGLATFYIGTVQKDSIWATELDGNDYVGDLVDIFDLSMAVAGSVPTPEKVAYVVFTLNISSTTITMASLDGIEIQMP